MGYNVFCYKQSPGCPIFLNALVHEKYWDNASKTGMDYDWLSVSSPGPNWRFDAPLPAELWLVTKDRGYTFDLKSDFSGHVISKAFLELMQDFGVDQYELAHLNLVSHKGEKIPSKEYYLMRFNFRRRIEDTINFDLSQIDFDKREGYIKRIRNLILASGPQPHLFVIDEAVLSKTLICSGAFKEKAIQAKLIGFEFRPVEEAGTITPA